MCTQLLFPGLAMNIDSLPRWYFYQSGVLPVRKKNGKLEVLLITTRNKKKWSIPKGIIEPGLSPQHSAEKEALEEAGIEGKVMNQSIGQFNTKKWGGTCVVEMFLMKVTKVYPHWQEDDFRHRKWYSFETAKKKIKKKSLRELIKKLPADLIKKI